MQFKVFDGYFAKLYDQVSTFGAWLDVVVDNLGRGILWVHLHKVNFYVKINEYF